MDRLGEGEGKHTLADDLSVDPPVPDYSEQECQCVDNRDRQAQFWGHAKYHDQHCTNEKNS